VSLLLAGAIVAGAAAVSVLLMAAVRRRLAAPLLNEPARGTPMTTFVGTAFAVLLAFITLAAFQTYNGAKTGAATEAVALLDMFKVPASFPLQSETSYAATSSATGVRSSIVSGRPCAGANAPRWLTPGSPPTGPCSNG
jgi:hypothetical protein